MEAWAARTPAWKGLRDHMKDPHFSVADKYELFRRWNYHGGGPHIDEFGDREHNGKGIPEKLDYDAAANADEFLRKNPKWKDEFMDFLVGEFPEEAPTSAYMSGSEELPPQTWLVHFTDDARGIKREGFKYGTPDVDGLGLTTWYGNEAKPGGYNFAFVAGGANARMVARSGKYGKEAVMFMSPAILVTHMSDDEYQAVFDGKRVDPRYIVVITRDGAEWVVNGKPRDPFRNEDFDRVQKWVAENWSQYQRVIMGGQR